jgi:hypothetical protein
MLLLNTFTSKPLVHKPVTVIGVSVSTLPDTGADIVAAVAGGGLAILPCNPVVPDCTGSELPKAEALPATATNTKLVINRAKMVRVFSLFIILNLP